MQRTAIRAPLSRRAMLALSAATLGSGSLAFGGGAARAQAAQTLSLAVAAPPTSLDPHYHTLSPNNMVAEHFFDKLVHRDANAKLVPGLAESWRMVSDDTWEFKLRQGVKFSNGDAFTAEDVVFTIKRVPNVVNSPGSFSIYTRGIVSSEIVDPHTIRFKTNGVYPLLPYDLNNVFIICKAVGDNVATGDFNNGKAVIGTGPFRLQSFTPDDRVVMTRNEEYWGDKPDWRQVTYRFITNDGVRVAALLSGDVQMIDVVPPADMPRLRSTQGITFSEIPSLRSIYLKLDTAHDSSPYITGPNGQRLDRNPLRDLRVRRALSIAINRQAIVDRVLQGAGLPTGQMMPPGANGYVADLPAPAYDVERAKALLAEAGYPNGFNITLIGPNNRYVSDAQIIQAVGQMWQRIGVRTTVDAMPFAVLAQRQARNDMSAMLIGWATSGEPSTAIRGNLTTRIPEKGFGTVNFSGYSNAEVDRLTEEGLRTADDAKREDLFKRAMRVAMDDVSLITLHMQKNIWAMRGGLTYEPRADEYTVAMNVNAPK
ncbi:ABC transporter substrate-binding protein [Pseudoroseomonas cervicalis]|uniref:ABC transporter substrate-binding protein n=1 Tax=Teichococcus cervicalis TaxID=204525 RepID=UPI0022F16527|nr:ABC transporter substrate-binding protein [Pseudoroseomonas cervicalis]WBV43826.1 ABC transporter substrate-binding protein [Pseudoroseomonas cervicalis]